MIYINIPGTRYCENGHTTQNTKATKCPTCSCPVLSKNRQKAIVKQEKINGRFDGLSAAEVEEEKEKLRKNAGRDIKCVKNYVSD